MLEDNSVVFSSSRRPFFLLMCGFNPLWKLAMHMQALMMVITIRTRVMTAKNVRDRRAGRYSLNQKGWYIRTSLNRKYAIAAKYRS